MVLMTHWHPDDLSGFIRETEAGTYDWHLVKFPALNEKEEALWPERWSADSLKKLRDTMDPIWWELLYQQEDPAKTGSSHWPLDYFSDMYVDQIPETNQEWPHIVVVDSSEGANDLSSIQYLKMIRNTIFTDGIAQVTPPEMSIDLAVQLAKKYNCRTLAIEAQTFKSLVMGEINRALHRHNWTDGVQVLTLQNYEDKSIRIMNLGTYFSRKRIKVVTNQAGRELVKEGKEWPNTSYDDCLDALEMGIRNLPLKKKAPHTPTDYTRLERIVS